MSGDHNMNQTTLGWRKRQIALEKMAENARELGLDYEPTKTVLEMTKEALKLAQKWQQTDWNTESPMSADFAVSEANDVISALMDALREALAEQPAQQEPVACLDCGSHNVGRSATYDSLINSVKTQPKQQPFGYLSIGDSPIFQKEKPEIGRWETLYTTPPQRKEKNT